MFFVVFFFFLEESLLGLAAEATDKKAAVWERERERRGGGAGGDVGFLRSREDPRMGSGGCRGARCSESGRRRWRGRRCTWALGGCWSGSEDTQRNGLRRLDFFVFVCE